MDKPRVCAHYVEDKKVWIVTFSHNGISATALDGDILRAAFMAGKYWRATQ